MWLSIIIPVYNAEKYLGTCLSSILSQPDKNFEVIAIDDGSTDNSWNILEQYRSKDDRLSTYKNPGKKLVGFSRNKGILHARGSYLWFIDADDWINPGAIDILCAEVKKEVQADILSFGYCEHHTVGGISEAFVRIPRHRLVETKSLSCFLQMKKGFTCMPFSYLFKRAFLRGNRVFFPVGCYFEDFYFMGKAFHYSACVSLIPRIIYNYNRNNPVSITRQQTPRKILDLLIMYARLQQFLQQQAAWEKHYYLFAFRFLIYGIPRCYRMYLCLPFKERRHPFLKNELQRIRKSEIMGLASIARASKLVRKISVEDESSKAEFRKNLHFVLCIKYALPVLEAAAVYKENKHRVWRIIQSLPLKFRPLQIFDRIRD